ncbi:Outer membrane protein PagN precursor [Legionella adelaidensis]|uniref:Outer membrane protein PagN n=1 Tax=Legionella adelaidensis TaxID=45056 RepID=A0A0W0R4C1_9GAMM|nr:outer membrane beta-barrel protein [Legionella adelaidensis]KTC65884.1 Outer membrane protein PagN precursor [Legionella adelaidensis]
MKLQKKITKIIALNLGLSTFVYAGAMGEIKADSPWHFELGSRYWLAQGKWTEELYAPASSALVSELTYSDLDINSAEAFWRLNNDNGFFFKGYFGGGSVTNGHLNDEDFPPGVVPYSNTFSPQKDGSLQYLSIDAGYNFISNPRWRAGAFVGYHYLSQRLNAFGCVQVAGNPDICAIGLPNTVNVLDESDAWNSLRLGINAAFAINSNFNIEADLAYLRSYLSGNDFHNLRPDIRGIPEDGKGNGVQLDAILNWAVTPDFSAGVGGRWWHIATDGFSRFEQTATSGQPQPIDITQEYYGLLLQANFKLDSVNTIAPSYDWNGAYIGVNIGYGGNPQTVIINPTSPEAGEVEAAALTPLNLNVTNAGFLGGAQIGYNWRVNSIVLGVEGDYDYAHISGSNAVTQSIDIFDFEIPFSTTTVTQELRSLATIRGRLGKLASENMLIYLTAGPAFGDVKLAFDQQIPLFDCDGGCVSGSASKNKFGWTGGAGFEYAVNEKFSLKGEYLYVDLGNLSINVNNPETNNHLISSKFDNNLVRLGVNYKI